MEKNQRSGSIQGLRGLLAFIFAYIFHYELLFQAMPVQMPVLRELFETLGRITFYASDIFFILSGYLTHQAYETRIENGRLSLRNYLVPKMKRIYPYVIGTVIANFLLERIGLRLLGYYPLHGDGGSVRYSLGALIANCAGIQSGWISEGDMLAVNGPSWFISILFLCYLLHYLQVRYIKNQKTRILMYGGMVVLGIFLLFQPVELPLLYKVCGRGYVGFYLGVLMHTGLERLGESVKKRLVIPIAAALVISVYLCATGWVNYMIPEVCVIFPAAVYLTIYEPVSKAILSGRMMQSLGRYSLVMYLCNIPTMTLIELCNQQWDWKLDYNNTLVWIGVILFSLFVTYIVHWFGKVIRTRNMGEMTNGITYSRKR